MPDEFRGRVDVIDAETVAVVADPQQPWDSIYLTHPQAKELIAALWRAMGEVQILRHA